MVIGNHPSELDMSTPFEPIEWYWSTAASGKVPCKWGGWINGKYYTVYLCSL